MKFLVLAKDYTGTVVTHKLQEEGHEVFYVNPLHRNNGISTIGSVHIGISHNPDCAIICHPEFTNEAQIIKQKKIPCFGGGLLESKLELDKDILLGFCKKYNIRTLKPTTKILHPLSIELWFSNGEPLYQYIGYIKQNKFLAGDLGPDVDGESIVLWGFENRDVDAVNRIFDHGLFEALKKIKYTGIMAFDTVISEDDHYPYIISAKPRLQAPVLLAMICQLKGEVGNLFLNIVQGQQCSLLLTDKLSIAVAVSNPPYPYDLSALIKYIVASDNDWIKARKKIAKQIKELDLPNIQYRIDGGMQAEYYQKYFNN